MLRENPACSYELVTPALRQGLAREEWARGDIPVIPFATERPRTVRMEVIPRAQSAAARASYVVLESDDAGRYAFELLMVRSGDRWRVAYWAPAGTLGPLSS